MIVTTSNQILNIVPTIQLDSGVDQVPANISNPDHSLTYTSGVGGQDFRISFGAQNNISYVAISGHNAASLDECIVRILNNGVSVDSVTISRNHNLLFTFDLTNFTDLQIVFEQSPNTAPTTVSYIAAGNYLVIPRGEQAGYSRQWLERHTTSQTSTNLLVAPTGTIQKKVALKGSLSIPNQTADFIETQWQSFIDFSYEQPFFIREDDSKPESTYICYDPKHKIQAHQSTRSLINANMQFSSYNGL